jgi:hypothetical protein
MTKKFYVTGANWSAYVDLSTYDHLTDSQLIYEACTQGLEQHIGKRTDVLYNAHKAITLTDEQKTENPLYAALVDLITTEISPNCGVGALLCVMEDVENPKDGKDHEWYINSKSILENVGIPSLVSIYDEKYPQMKNS